MVAFIAKEKEKVVATVLLLVTEKPSNPNFIHGRTAEVLNVYTLKEYQHRGIATELMNRLIAYSTENKIDRIELLATDEGYELYKKIGFRDTIVPYRRLRFETKLK